MALTCSSDELFMQPVGQDGFCQTSVHDKNHITAQPRFSIKRATMCFLLPKIIFEATSDGLVVPGICI